MKKLFMVTAPDKSVRYFENKIDAKKYRDSLTNARVQLGPDHYRYKEK
jgi:hypothetical protein